ncbi:hypothetical protein ACIBG5_28870 [Kribbella sp. NPDC050241]
MALAGPQQYAEDELGRADHDEPGQQLNRTPEEAQAEGEAASAVLPAVG